ncbi:HNH endonuclease signature motif containing protein [Caballeronia sp. LZ008]|uniref:HNH endonuclease signature motif containing protein n=1 Tax=unclassified Caballeronia TaxID=2646786 RepID=UPI002028718E|nr:MULTISPECIES: HNH endonuclease signature motif containing protein [unclassified Caballeronia]MDR5794494.1 HNH endonuclease signature motif containing protein [Caballeronia sp. LZ008]
MNADGKKCDPELPSGYFRIPGNDKVAIKRTGECLNLLTGNQIKVVSNREKGYRTVHVAVRGKTHNFYHHRLLAAAFIPKPDRHNRRSLRDLQVNHIDGNKSNNSLENLEWVTALENIRHVFAMGLKHRRDRGFPYVRRDRLTFSVYAKDIRSGELKYFKSSDACADVFGVSRLRLRKHLSSKRAGYVTKQWCVFRYADQLPFPDLKDEHREENSWDMSFGAWIATDKETGNCHIASTLNELATAIGLRVCALQNLHQRNLNEPYLGRWYVRYEFNVLPDALKRVSHYKDRVIFPPKTVIATNRVTGKQERYVSRNIAGTALDIHPDRIRYAVKAKKGVLGDWSFCEVDSPTPLSIRVNRVAFKKHLHHRQSEWLRPERSDGYFVGSTVSKEGDDATDKAAELAGSDTDSEGEGQRAQFRTTMVEPWNQQYKGAATWSSFEAKLTA